MSIIMLLIENEKSGIIVAAKVAKRIATSDAIFWVNLY